MHRPGNSWSIRSSTWQSTYIGASRQRSISCLPHLTPKIMQLIYILLFVSSHVATAANPSNIPPPLPKDKWTGKSNLNYTALHDTLAEPLLCLDIPVGVL